MLVAVYGGSFNPLHYGHIGIAAWVAEHTEVDEVWLMVTPNNPLKNEAILADEQQRLQAAQQQIAPLQAEQCNNKAKQHNNIGIARVRVSDFEFSLPRPSYTANTLRELQKAYPEHSFALLIGQDNWDVRHRWREWEYIQTTFPVYVYPRGKEGMKEIKRELENIPADIHLLEDAPLFDISSTQIREQRKQNK